MPPVHKAPAIRAIKTAVSDLSVSLDFTATLSIALTAVVEEISSKFDADTPGLEERLGEIHDCLFTLRADAKAAREMQS